MNSVTKRNFLVFILLVIVCVALVIILICFGNSNAKKRDNEADKENTSDMLEGASAEPTIDVIRFTPDPIVASGTNPPGTDNLSTSNPDTDNTRIPEDDTHSDVATPIYLYIKLASSDSTLNVRASASTDSEIVGTLRHGEKILLKELSGGWAQIEAGDTSGYVKVEFMSVSKPE